MAELQDKINQMQQWKQDIGRPAGTKSQYLAAEAQLQSEIDVLMAAEQVLRDAEIAAQEAALKPTLEERVDAIEEIVGLDVEQGLP